MAEEEEDYASYMARGGAIVFFALIGAAVFAVVTRIILARTLSTTEYGLLFSVISFVSLLQVFRTMGLSSALTKFASEYKARGKFDEVKSVLLTTISFESASTTVLTIVLIALSGWLGAVYFEHEMASSVLVVLAVWGAAMMTKSYLKTTFRAFKDMYGYEGIVMVRNGFTLGLIVLSVLFFGPGLIGIAVAYLLGAVFTTLLFYVLLRSRHSRYLRGDGSVSGPWVRKLLTFAVPMLLAGVAGTVMGYTDSLMLTGLRDLEAVGLYEVAKPSAKYLRYFGIAIAAPLFPMVSELWSRGEERRVGSTIGILAKFSVVAILPAAIILLAFPHIVINLLYGSEYLGAVNALRILTVGTVFYSGSRILGPVLSGTDHPGLVMKSSAVAAVLNVVANLALIPPFGAGGAALATSLSFLLMLVLRYHFSKGIVDFSIPVESIFKALLCGGGSLLILIGLKEAIDITPWIQAVVIIIPVMGFYLVSIFRLNVITKEDVELFERSTPVPKKLLRILERLVTD